MLRLLDALEAFLQDNTELAYRMLTRTSLEQVIPRVQAVKALRIVRHAARNVPAYAAFLEEHGWRREHVERMRWEDWERLPITTKENYVKQYALEARCVHGRLPVRGKIDESGGSSGRPTEWVHGIEEEERLRRIVRFYKRIWWPDVDRIIVLNALSCGPWSGGVTLTILLREQLLVKTIGTDIPGVLRTLEQFGTKHQYIIIGYPLFLTDLLQADFPWKKYKIDLLTGGDAHSVEWQRRVERIIRGRVISAYGSSDVDVGVAVETPLTQALRREVKRNKALREAISWYADVPMLFQYNPLDILIEQEGHELIMTHFDVKKTQPVVRYNIHDEGKVFSYTEMRRLVERLAPRIAKVFEEEHLRLPFVTIEGRSDGTISLDGANVHPSEVEEILFKEKAVHKFKLVRREEPPYFVILVELARGVKPSKALAKRLEARVRKELVVLNRDYAESLRANPHVAPRIILVPYGKTRAFSMEGRKYKWIVREEHLKAYGIRV